jgi:hypothetical protein
MPGQIGPEYAQEESRLSQKEKAVQKAKERAKAKAKELGYPDDAVEKMLNNRAVVVGECAWLEQYIEELRQINCHFIESPSQELDADFRKAGATSVLRPHKHDWGLRDWWR